eukprot:TRINITY_DN5851_c0_g1_i3.p4 TRINITY_DN5851_c0_g1~~TRINITY_DN5851_c0_g1_i3.p4  ORF type:complete len:172 (-),score=2.07 TRINITY_DN5851_c0_g1_i3:263-778(-)
MANKRISSKFKRFDNVYLKYHIREGWSFEQIQRDLLAHSVYDIRIQAKNLGLKHPRNWTEHELQMLKCGLDNGMGYDLIRDEFLSHRNLVSLYMKARKGWNNKREAWTDQDLLLLKQGMDSGLTYKEIVNKYLPNRTSETFKKSSQKARLETQNFQRNLVSTRFGFIKKRY